MRSVAPFRSITYVRSSFRITRNGPSDGDCIQLHVAFPFSRVRLSRRCNYVYVCRNLAYNGLSSQEVEYTRALSYRLVVLRSRFVVLASDVFVNVRYGAMRTRAEVVIKLTRMASCPWIDERGYYTRTLKRWRIGPNRLGVH